MKNIIQHDQNNEIQQLVLLKKPRRTRRKRRVLYKEKLPNKLTTKEKGIAVGLVLSDRNLYKGKTGASMKVEFTYKHHYFVEYLFQLFQQWTWFEKPSVYYYKTGKFRGTPRSSYFYTFIHTAWLEVWDLCYDQNNKKKYKRGTIEKHLTIEG